ncbi:MAG: hypothetical protein M9938_04195 [Solirubrobacterales bacterium]|nr:hypothetical protein [Solirubrobacterales bacterium]
MGREQGVGVFTCVVAATGLAVLALSGLATTASAKPADRGGDAVVMKGAKVKGMLGTAPGKIVGFVRRRGKWIQVPVQVDQRHRIDVRQLYPSQTDPPQLGSNYPGGNNPAFDLEVYADPNTRSGPDGNPRFDADDELVFIGADTGRRAPKKARAPRRVNGNTGTRVTVRDPVGGGRAYLYLFRSNGRLRQSAGRDYVKYSFKLTNLPAGQKLKDGYGFFHSTNPEDSSVTTRSYRLHSVDRWMEDELRVRAGKANRADILDREVAQATRFSCGRSQYTFSGRWTEDIFSGNDDDTDDEGTYVAAIDGPVRAIRSYMGANSGPYTQREHIYYGSHEQNTVFLRVHPMTDLYTWTDYSGSAIGMTYRDAKNTAGVKVDGKPDTLTPATQADVADGRYAWQQLSGKQGTVSTVIGADTNIPQVRFGSYYLDDQNPPLGQTQCGGDGKSIGASGFGILGTAFGTVTPNTDPRHPPFNDLTVKRIRYFTAPGGGSTLARRLTTRVSRPLAGSAARSPVRKSR